MSQRIVHKGDLEFMMGWDRPLRYHFLTIFDNSNDEAEIIFNNLDLPNPSMSIDEITAACLKFGLELPKKVIDQLAYDKANDIGTVISRYYV